MNDVREKIFTLPFNILATCNFLGAMNFYLLTAVFTEYCLKHYGLPYSTAALSVSLYVIGALVARLFLGGRIDSWGIKKSLIGGYVVIALTSCLYVFALPYGALLASRFVQGLGFGVASGASASGAVLLVPASRRAEGIGYFSMTQALATGIGPFVAIALIAGTGGYQVLFAVTAAMAILMAALSFLVRLPGQSASGQGAETYDQNMTDHCCEAPRQASPNKAKPFSGGSRWWETFIHPKVLPFGVVMLMVIFCYSGLITYLTLYASDLGLSQFASWYFVIYASAILISRPPLGRMADRRGENSVVRMTIPALAVGLVALGVAGLLQSGPLMLVSAALTGLGVGSTQSVLQAVVPKVVSRHEIGRGNSTFFLMMDLGSGIGPVLLGVIVPFAGYEAMFFLLAGWALLALVVYFLVHGRKLG